LGEGPISSVLAAREDGPFSSLFDLCARTDPRKVNRRALEALIKSGALDELGVERWVMLAALDDAIKRAEQVASNTAAGIDDLFGEVIATAGDADDPYKEYRGARPWSLVELLNAEKESLGSFLSGHPIEAYEAEVRKFAPRRIRELQANNQAVVAGLILDIRTIKTQRGPMAVLTLDDGSGQMEAAVYNDVFTEHRDLLQKDRIVLLDGRLQVDDFNGGLAMRTTTVRSLEQARKAKVSQLRLRGAEPSRRRTFQYLTGQHAALCGGRAVPRCNGICAAKRICRCASGWRLAGPSERRATGRAAHCGGERCSGVGV